MVARMVLGATLAVIAAAPATARQSTADRAAPAAIQGRAPAPPGATPRDAKAILRNAAEAMKKANALRYHANVGGQGVGSVARTRVSFARADAGGWKISVVGELFSKNPDGSTTSLRTIEIGYDGVTARSISQSDKVVAEYDIRKPDELKTFLNNHDGGASVIWEAIEPEPFASALAAPTLKAIGTDKVEGVECDVVRFEAPGSDADTQVIEIAIAAEDHLPRRVSRSRKPEKPDDKVTSRVTTMTEVAANDGVLGAFVLSTPDGFMVKSETPRKPKPEAPKREQGPQQPLAERGLLANGTEAPAWTLKDSDGKDVKLSDYKGKVVVLDFWGSWCPPCRAAMPGIQKLHEKYKDRGVAVVGMNFERNAAANPAKFMKDNGYTYNLVLKADTIADKYKVNGWPTFYILDKQGKVLWSAVGHDPSHEEQMAKVIEEALK